MSATMERRHDRPVGAGDEDVAHRRAIDPAEEQTRDEGRVQRRRKDMEPRTRRHQRRRRRRADATGDDHYELQLPDASAGQNEKGPDAPAETDRSDDGDEQRRNGFRQRVALPGSNPEPDAEEDERAQ